MSAAAFRQTSSRRRADWLLIAIILLGVACRLYQLNTPSLRGDEAFTVMHWMREPLGQTLSSIVTIDPQPPLAYTAYRAFALLVGAQEGVVRLLPALASAIGIPACYALGTRLAGRRTGLFAALCYALSPAVVWHAQDARNYALWAAVSPLALFAALNALHRRRLRDWALYVFIAAIACYLYYLELLFVLTLNLVMMLSCLRQRRLLLHWLLAQAALALILLPWFGQPSLLSGGGYGGTGSHTDLPLLLTEFVPALVYGTSLAGLALPVATALACVLALIGARSLWRRSRTAALLCALWITLPMIGLSLISLRLAVFVPRYILASAPVWFVLIGSGVFSLLNTRQSPIRLAGVLSGIGFSAFVLLSLFNHFFVYDYAKAPDWRTVSSYLSTHATPDHLIINQAADPALTFYLEEARVPAEWMYLPANPRQSATEITALIEQRLSQGRAVWLVARPPDWPNQTVPADVLRQRAQPVRDLLIAGLPVTEYLPPPQPATPLAEFGGAIALLDVDISPVHDPDGMLRVFLTWQTLSRTSAPLKSFLHLLPAGQSGIPPLAQDDQFPSDGAIRSTDWPEGARFREIYALPVGALPAGNYLLRAGWYDPDTDVRLLLPDKSDGASIGELRLQGP